MYNCILRAPAFRVLSAGGGQEMMVVSFDAGYSTVLGGHYMVWTGEHQGDNTEAYPKIIS